VKTFQKYTTYTPIILVTLALLLLGIWLGHLGWHAYHLWKLASITEGLAQSSLDALEPAQVQDLVHRAAAHLSAIDGDLQTVYPLLRFASALPGVGKYSGQVQPLMEFGLSMADAGDRVLTGLSPLWALDHPETASTSASERIFLALQAGHPQFENASQLLERASLARSKIAPELLPERFGTLFARIDKGFPLLKGGISLLAHAPDLMGPVQPALYLVLAQNSDELRATGGFISGIGTIRLERGKIVDFQMSDSYAVDDFSKGYPPPPEPIQRLMLAGYWVPRDANWSPDFPTSALQVQSLYALSTGVSTQGVIAFDQAAVRELLGVTGPVSLSDMPEPITSKNIERIMQQSWEPAPGEKISMEWWRGRKDFMGILGKALLEKILQSGEPKALLALGKIGLKLVQAGHILVYLDDPNAQQSLQDSGLAHAIAPDDGDYLMVVDSNVGFNKTDSLIQREIEYQLDLSDFDNPSAQVILKYEHKGRAGIACVHQADYGGGTYDELKQRCYWDYWRVYLPSDSVFQRAQVKPVQGNLLLGGQPWPGAVEIYPGENGTQVFAGVMVLPSGVQDQSILEYTLPGRVVHREASGGWRYKLRIRKQPGVPRLLVRMEVHLPEGMSLRTVPPGWAQVSPTVWMFSVDMLQDIQVNLWMIPSP
jgi:hypothetical protein